MKEVCLIGLIRNAINDLVVMGYSEFVLHPPTLVVYQARPPLGKTFLEGERLAGLIDKYPFAEKGFSNFN